MTQPQFDAREALLAVEMEKTTDFIVVEGVEVDVFDNALRGMLNQKGHETGWVVISGADKETILNFFKNSAVKNAYAILDRDFDSALGGDQRISCLTRYSIENFLFDEPVIRQTSARFYRKTAAKIESNIHEVMAHYEVELANLLDVLQCYQAAKCEHKVKWSEVSILIKDCWMINSGSVENLIKMISEDYKIVQNGGVGDLQIIKDFPAKMIAKGIYHYIRKVESPPGFTKVFNNERAFLHALYGNIEYSKDFISCLTGARDFLLRRGCAA